MWILSATREMTRGKIFDIEFISCSECQVRWEDSLVLDLEYWILVNSVFGQVENKVNKNHCAV